VNLLPDEHEHALIADALVPFKVFDQHVVVGDDDRVQPLADGGRGNVLVQAAPVRVARVHVQVDSNFVHEDYSCGILESGIAGNLLFLFLAANFMNSRELFLSISRKFAVEEFASWYAHPVFRKLFDDLSFSQV
jgi:hypothetical protein